MTGETRRCQDEKRLAAKLSGCDTDAVWNGLSRRHSLARAEHVLPCSLGVSSSTLLGGPFDFSASREGTCEPASHVTGIYIHHECHYEQFSPRAFVTSDGVQLSYIRQGSGRPIVLLHGWSQCAEEFKHQIEPLSVRYDVIAVDQRSHGESQKVSYGLKISRLSKDLYELLTELDLNNVTLLGHSMGSCVIWCYLDLFGPERLSKIILVDQPPLVTSDPHWTPRNWKMRALP